MLSNFYQESEMLSLSHNALLQERFAKLNLDISEYNFPNLFCFRNVHQYELIFNDSIFIKGKTYDNKWYLMPTSDIRSVNEDVLKALIQTVDFLFPIPEEWTKFLDPIKFEITSLEEDNDYVYNIEKLANYSGRHLAGKRNLVRQFLDQYEVHSSSLTSFAVNDALKVVEEWESSYEKELETNDSSACREALENFESLGLRGTIYYVDNKPAAIILGAKLNASMFVVHFAKADRNLKGIYQYIYQAFAKELLTIFKTFNMEQDLGYVGLRQSKRSYLPDAVIKKFRIGIKKF